MASASNTADSAALNKNKEQVEVTLDRLLTGFKEKAQLKLQICIRRQSQKAQLDEVLVCNDLETNIAPGSGLPVVPQSAAELALLAAENNSKLTTCEQLVTAFGNTQKARDALNACLESEQKLLSQLDHPVQHSLQLSLQAVTLAATNLRLDDPQREQRQTEMLLRCTVTLYLAFAVLALIPHVCGSLSFT